MVARWVPLPERGRFISRCFLGTNFGTMITFPLCGVIVANMGWEAAFYVIGAISMVWFVFWMLLVFDGPECHPRIEPEELLRLIAAVGLNSDVRI